MEVEFTEQNGVVVLRPKGASLDEESIDDLSSGYDRAAGCSARAVVIDLESIERIDSVGLFGLIKGYRYIEGERTIHLCNVTPGLVSVLERIQYDEVFGIHESLEAALKSIG